MQCLEYSYTEKGFVVYTKSKFNWHPAFLFAKSGNHRRPAFCDSGVHLGSMFSPSLKIHHVLVLHCL